MPEDDKSDTFGSIKITKIPSGEAPLWVREQWVDLVLPCQPVVQTHKVFGVLRRIVRPKGRRVFSVPQKEALEILAGKLKVAADWFQMSGYPQPDGFFGFGVDEAQIVEGVTFEVIKERDDDGTDPEK